LKLLIVEDEKKLSDAICQYLSEQAYTCEQVSTSEEALRLLEVLEFDCILLDLGLPDSSGFELLHEIKDMKPEQPVIILSARDSTFNKIEGLENGADDYLAKPFHLAELNARVSAILRRRFFDGHRVTVCGDILIDTQARVVTVNKEPIELTRKEYNLLLFLVANENRVLSKAAIAENLNADGEEIYDNYDFLYTHMKNLKKKLAVAGSEDYIKTVYGMGYKFSSK